MRWPPWSSRSAEDRVARLQQREVGGHVRLRARVRLDVRVLGAEELLRPVDRELLDLVDDLAAAVVAAAGIALGVLVRRHGADRLEHARPGEVLRRDQLDLAALALELAAEQVGDLGVDVGEAGGAKLVERFLGDGHAFLLEPGDRFDARAPSRRPGARRRPAPRPRAARRGSAPVKSITVDGVPGSSPPSTSAAAAARISLRHLVERAADRARRAGSRSSRRSTPTLGQHLAARTGELGHAHADRLGLAPGQPAEAARGVRQHERERPGQQRARDRAGAPASSGTHSKSRSRSAATSAVGCSSSRPLAR